MRRTLTMSRREVAWLLLGLVLIQGTLALALDGARPELRDPEYGHKLGQLRQRLRENPSRPLILVTGSSRVLNGLRAGDIGPDGPLVFNFGLTRHGPVKQLLCVRRLLDDGIVPAGVVMEICPPMLPLGGRGIDAPEVGQQKWSDLPALSAYDGPAKWLYARWLGERVAPTYSQRHAILGKLAPQFVPWAHREDAFWERTDGFGWYPMAEPASANVRRIEEQRTLDGHGLLLRTAFTVVPVSAQALRETISVLRRRAVPTVALVLPEADALRGCYGPGAEQRLADYLAELRRRELLPVIDGRSWVTANADYRDAHHLLPLAAATFTARFARDVLPLFSETSVPPPETSPLALRRSSRARLD